MNNERRAMLRRAADMIAEASQLIEQAQEGEQEAYENTPDSLKEGEAGQALERMADAIAEVLCTVNDAHGELVELVEKAT